MAPRRRLMARSEYGINLFLVLTIAVVCGWMVSEGHHGWAAGWALFWLLATLGDGYTVDFD